MRREISAEYVRFQTGRTESFCAVLPFPGRACEGTYVQKLNAYPEILFFRFFNRTG